MDKMKKLNTEAAAKIEAVRANTNALNSPEAKAARAERTRAANERAMALQAANAGANLNVEGKTGSEIIDLIKQGNVGLKLKFIADAKLYQNDPESVHNNLELFVTDIRFGHLFLSVAKKNPSLLIPYVPIFLNQLRNKTGGFIISSSGAESSFNMILLIFEEIACQNPNIIFPYIDEIRDICSAQRYGGSSYAKLVGKLANCTGVVPHGPDFAFGLLMKMLEKSVDNTVGVIILAQISNVMTSLSSRQVLIDAMPIITRCRSSNEIVYTHINDFANDRSLEKISEKVDALEQKVKALNGEVSRTCANMADVIAYVDANMADMKDFLAEVVKKLPQPTRLQVDGTMRKTLILVFVCCDTGLEYGITSTEWSKWLKIGFSLVKAGTAVIDLGMGNPLGILKKGVDCVQEIYQAYKTNDDDEFNTYITQPFLTSAEQDKLLEKLREQKFFDKFAYNAQKHGWYLLDPHRDGQTEFNAADMSLTNALVGAAANALSLSDEATDALTMVADTVASHSVSDSAVLTSSGKSSSNKNPMHTSPAPSPAYVSGGRAAAMKETFKETYGDGVVTAAEARVELATVQAKSNSDHAELAKRMEAMEDEVKKLKIKVALLEQSAARRGRCIIM